MVEVLVAVAVGGILLVVASAAILSVIRQNFESRSSQISATIGYDLINKVKSFTGADWHNVYDLVHGQSNTYYIVSSATSSIAVAGQESVLSNDIESGMVGYWKFDEATTTLSYDSSGNGNVGNILGGTTRITGTSCQMGGCLSFDGASGNVDLGLNTAIFGDNTSSRTISAWVYPTALSSSTIFNTEPDSVDGESYLRTIANGPGVNFRMIWKSDSSNYTTVDSLSSYPPNAWYLVTGVVDFSGGETYIYVNGALAGTGSNVSSLFYQSAPNGTRHARIGATFQSSPTQYFPGYLDDVRAYKRALSANEISQIYNGSVYTRYFYVDNVNRTQCGVGSISTNNTSGCISVLGAGDSDIGDDASTQKASIVVTRSDGASSQFSEYLTRSKNQTFVQNDWSAGGGQDGPYSSAISGFSTSTNIAISGKSLTTATTTGDGTLYSSTFDTQITNGAAFNSIVWQGSSPSGTQVKFQLASGNVTSGTGGGPTGAIDSVYRYAWNDKIGWIDFGYSAGNVNVGSSSLSGYAYNDDIGEISLDCATSPSGNICGTSNYNVARNNSTGDLSGWAWNDEIGWISFSSSSPAYKVNVNVTNGYFSGYAWNDIIGWISFNCADIGACGTADYKVATTNTGGWQYIGPDGTSLTYYNTGGLTLNTSQPISLRYHNNHRYIRYKVVLTPSGGNSPTVNSVILNWSP